MQRNQNCFGCSNKKKKKKTAASKEEVIKKLLWQRRENLIAILYGEIIFADTCTSSSCFFIDFAINNIIKEICAASKEEVTSFILVKEPIIQVRRK